MKCAIENDRLLKQTLMLFCLLFLVTGVSCSSKEEKIVESQKNAEGYIEAGQYRRAMIELKSLVQLDPENDAAFYYLGEVYINLKYEDDAYKSFTRAVSINPENIMAQLRLGQIFLVGKETKEARKIAKMILKKSPNHVEALQLLAGIQVQERNFDYALITLEKAASIDPKHFKTYLFLAHLHFYKGNLQKAEKNYLKAISLNQSLRAPYIELANLYGTKGELDKVESFLKKMVQTPGEKTQKLIDLASFYENQKQWDQAERTYLAAVALASGNDNKPLVELGLYFVRRKSYDKAMEAMQKALAMKENDTAILLTISKIYFAMERLEDAEKIVDRILQRDKRHEDANYLKGRFYLIREDSINALEHFNLIIEDKTVNPMAYFYRAVCFLKKGGRTLAGLDLIKAAAGYSDVGSWERDQAVQNLLKAVEISPELIDARLMLTELYLQDQKKGQANLHIQASLKQNPGHLKALELLVNLNILKSDIKKAEAVCNKMLKLDPNYAVSYVKLGLVYTFSERNEDAIKSFKKALDLNPLQIDALNFLVGIYIKDKKISEAIEICENHKKKTMNNQPVVAIIEYLEGKIFMSKGDIAKAKQYILKGIKSYPDIIAPYETLARIYEQEKNIPQAIVQYETILKKKPAYLPAYMAIGRIYDFQDQKEKAEHYYREALKIKNNYAPAANNLAFNMAARGANLDEALKLARLAKREDPHNADVLDTLGWLYYLHGSYLLAISELQESLSLNPDNPLANYHMGWAYYEKKEFEKARKFMAKALKLDPNFKGADEARSIIGK